MVKMVAWALSAYFLIFNGLFARGNDRAIQLAAHEAFLPVVQVVTPQRKCTATLMHVDGNPFFLTAKHGVSRQKGLWVESGHQCFAIRGVQALRGDMALLFPKGRLPKRLLQAAIDIELASSIISMPQGFIQHNRIPFDTKYISLNGFPHIQGFGTGFGAPVLGWRGPIGLLDWRSPSTKNAFTLELDGVGSDLFGVGQNCVAYDLKSDHTLYYRARPDGGGT